MFDDVDEPEAEPTVMEEQRKRRGEMLANMESKANAAKRAANFVIDIIAQNENRMKFDENQNLVITGQLALYRINLNNFMIKFVNPFSYNSFDVVEVHPKRGLVSSPNTACVQVQHQKQEMPGYDLLAGYILGLLNDDVTWLEEGLNPLRNTLLDIYGLTSSPLTPTLSRHLAKMYEATFDFQNDTLTVPGTNGWRWRINFGQPLAKGYKIEYQKPRQTWWNVMFEDHMKETTGHYSLCGFMDIVENFSTYPAALKTAREWLVDPILLRMVAKNYPPLARVVLPVIEAPEYDASQLHDYFDEEEYLSEEHAHIIMRLDGEIRQRAYA